MKKRGMLSLLLVMMLVLLSACSSGNDVSRTYDEAMNRIKKGEFAEAASVLENISFYEDSVQLAQYCRAQACASEGGCSEAVTRLEALGSYRDSMQWAAYYRAKALEESASTPSAHALAASLYNAEVLREFQDAAARAEAIRTALYQEGAEAEENGKWEDTAEYFAALEEYLDSAVRFAYASGRLCEADGEKDPLIYAEAIRNYENAESYADAANRAKECLNAVFAKADQYIADGDFDSADTLYSALGDRCDEERKAALQKAKEDAEKAACQQRIAEAEALAEENRFDDARVIYMELDENEKATDMLYRKAAFLAQEGSILDASALYMDILDYQDSREQHYLLGVNHIDTDPVIASAILLEDWDYKDARSRLYEIAVKASSEENYPLSISVFNELGSTWDCILRKMNDLYLYGRKLLEDGQNDKAAGIFDSISGTGSAALYANMARYAAAEKLEKDGSLTEAASAFEQIGDYEDAKDRARQCRYAYGLEEKKAENYENAATVFNLLGSYEKSKDLKKECLYLLAGQFEEAQNWSRAVEVYEEISDYKDSAVRCRACYNGLGENQLENGEAEKAWRSFVKGGDQDGQARAAFAVAEAKTAEYSLEDALEWYRKAAALPETEARSAMIAESLLNMEEDELSEQYATVAAGSEKGREVLYALAIRSLERQDEDSAMRQMQKAGDSADASERFQEMLKARVDALVAGNKYDEAADLCASYGDQKQAEALLKRKAELEEQERQRIAEARREEHQARIDEANALLEKEEYQAAADIFTEIGETGLAEDAMARKTAAEEEEKRRKNKAREEEGNNFLASGDYDGAIEIYRELEDQERICEAIYLKAEALNQPELYLEIAEYKDSREKHYLAGMALLDSDPENAYRILAEDLEYPGVQSVLYTLADRESAEGNYTLSSAIFSMLGSQPLDPSEPRPDCQMRSVQDLYQYGLALQEQGEWQLAANIFDTLENLSNAKIHSNEAYYAIAADLKKNGKYAEAALSFEALGDYSDAAEQAKMNRYLAARMQVIAEDYEAAENAFTALGEYIDSAEQAKECRYCRAMNLLQDGNFQEALELFNSLDEYEDSGNQANECIYRIAGKLQEQAQYEQAVTQYESIPEYKDSEEKLKACCESLGDLETAQAEELLQKDERMQAAEHYEAAWKYYGKAETEEKKISSALLAGSCCQSGNDYDKAAEWYGKAGPEGESYLLGIVRYALATEQDNAAERYLVGFGSEKCRELLYEMAEKKLSGEDTEAALRLFAEAGDYGDAAYRHDDIIYQQAEELEEKQDYAAAAELFGSVPEHRDAAERKNVSIYRYAETSAEKKEYKEAVKAFRSLGEYADASERVTEYSKFLTKAGNIVKFGHYEQDNSQKNGMEPVEWIVLDVQDDKALLLSRYGLDVKPYHNKLENVTWETCDIRKWLNDEFISTAFSTEEMSAVLWTDVDNSDSQGYKGWNTKGGNNTRDRIFLLSYAEVHQYLGLEYGDKKKKTRAEPTVYARNHGAYVNRSYKTEDGADAASWWLRSPGSAQRKAADVLYYGSLRDYTVNFNKAIVRPVLWIDLTSDLF